MNYKYLLVLAIIALSTGRCSRSLNNVTQNPIKPTIYALAESAIYKSEDTGNTWVSITNGLSLYYRGVFFLNNAKGFFITDSMMFVTQDGGNNWTDISTKFPIGVNFTSINFINSTLGFVFCYYNPPIYPEPVPRIFKTTDGGTTWVASDAGTNPKDAFRHSFFVNSNTGFVVGEKTDRGGFPDGSVLYKTNDGGQNWQAMENGIKGGGLTSVFFSNSQIGYTLGDSAFVTTDQGQTWVDLSVQPAAYSSTGYAVYFLNNQVGYICGSGGLILYTVNNGLSWSLDNKGINGHAVYDIKALDSNHVFAATNTSVLLSSGSQQQWQTVFTGTMIRNLFILK
ncbi:MAG: YCF48-related protein [Phycisphaerales bacterium]|nr:YCF48-related protein [Phycisphaerales bacterium]